MKTHFIRLKPRLNNTVSSVIESLLVDSLPADKLVDVEEIYSLFEKNCRKNSERTPAFAGMLGILKSVCAHGLVKEVPGIRLERFLDTF